MYEVMFFPEVLTAPRPLLEAGRSVLLKASATWEGEELKLRALWVKDLDSEAAQAGEGLRVRLNDAAALGALAEQLRQPGKGIVTLVVPGAAGEEVEIALPKRQQVSVAMKEAIRTLPGVVAVESVNPWIEMDVAANHSPWAASEPPIQPLDGRVKPGHGE